MPRGKKQEIPMCQHYTASTNFLAPSQTDATRRRSLYPTSTPSTRHQHAIDATRVEAAEALLAVAVPGLHH